MFIEVLTPGDRVDGDECPAFAPGHTASSPSLTAVVTPSAVSTKGKGLGDYFTVASTTRVAPPLRSTRLHCAAGISSWLPSPTSGITGTLDRLLLLELAVTGGALAVAVLVGLWLVRLGLRPLRDVVRTAEAITGGDLVHRSLMPLPAPKWAGSPRHST